MTVTIAPPKPVSTRQTMQSRRCKCGCTEFREASRIRQPGGPDSVMYECIACGAYRL